MSNSKSVVTFIGDAGTGRQPHVIPISFDCLVLPDGTKVAAFNTWLNTVSAANVSKIGVTGVTLYPVSAPGANVNLDERAQFYLTDMFTGHTVVVSIPAWDVVAFPPTLDADGKRFSKTIIDGVADAVSAFTGKALVGAWGKWISKT